MSPMPWRSAWVVATLSLSGCAVGGALGSTALNAAVNTGIGLGAAVASRSSGGCYASCPAGTTCNKSTGYCDPLPCRGECSPFEECVEEKLLYHCVARSPSNGKIIINPAQSSSEQKPAEQKPPEQKPPEQKPPEPNP